MSTTSDQKLAKMSSHFAVFNLHINKAHKRALKDVQGEFGNRGKRTIMDFYAQGIMDIFEQPPTPVTQFYVDKVTEYVNEDRV